jgi:hypothetical protein
MQAGPDVRPVWRQRDTRPTNRAIVESWKALANSARDLEDPLDLDRLRRHEAADADR